MDNRLYEILGLSSAASVADVRAAYRKLARRYHPDVAGPSSASKFAEISRAHDALIERLESKHAAPSAPPFPQAPPAHAPIFAFQTAPAHGFSSPMRERGGDLIDETVTDILNDIDDVISSFGDIFGDSRRRR